MLNDSFLSDAVCSNLYAKYTYWAKELTKENCCKLLISVHVISKVYAAAKKQSEALKDSNLGLPGAGIVRAEVSLYSLSRLPGKKKYVGICPYNDELPVRRGTAFKSMFREELLNGQEALNWAADMSALWFERLVWDVGEFGVRTVYGREKTSEYSLILPVITADIHFMELHSAVRILQEVYRSCKISAAG